MSDHDNFLLRYGTDANIKQVLTSTAEGYTQAGFLLRATKNPAAGPDIFHMAWNHPGLHEKIASNPRLPSELHQAALNSDNPKVQLAALDNPNTRRSHVEDRFENTEHREVREKASIMRHFERYQRDDT